MLISTSAADRSFRPPRRLRGVVPSAVGGSDLLVMAATPGPAQEWANVTVDGLVAAVDAEAAAARGCTDCTDTGFYGITDTRDPDLLVRLLKRRGENGYEVLLSTGEWVPYDPAGIDVEMIDVDTAGELATVVTAGGAGLLRRWCSPLLFLPGDGQHTAIMAAGGQIPDTSDDWDYYGIVDDVDTTAVLDVVRVNNTGCQRFIDGQWVDDALEPDQDVSVVAMAGELLNQALTAALPKQQKCAYCTEQATQRIIHAEGMAYIPVCDEHLDKGKHDAERSTPNGSPDPSNIDGIRPIKADAPLTVSPDPRAEKLRRYWSTGRGAAKIRWHTKGDWRRCYRHLRKYMGLRAKGYCQNLHKRNNGFWTGDRRNRGLISSLPEEPTSPERQLVASIQDGSWTHQEGTPAMDTDVLPDGIYCEASADDAVLRTLLAGGFPVAPPDAWFANPKLEGPTPMTVDDDGKVYGHIATWDSIHIGMAGAVRAPKSRSGYAYFQTGSLKTDTGKLVNVGQLTLAGGHAPLTSDAAAAVKHYDDTNSAVADVTVGEDRYGIWAAGALRPSVTPEQLRTFRASPLSGDWRPINGGLELVAACAVNVPGFPIARARVASGSVQALVAAGAGQLALIAAARNTDTGLAARLDKLERLVAALVPQPDEKTDNTDPIDSADADQPGDGTVDPEDPEVDVPKPKVASGETDTAVLDAPAEEQAESTEQVPQVDGEKLPEVTDEQVAEMRAEIEALRAAKIRSEVDDIVAGGLPPQFAKKGERPGIGGYPINNAKDLENAIQAFGRSKPADRDKTKQHIITRAKALGLTSKLPDDWK